MRFLFLAAALVLSLPALPQEKSKNKPAAKQAAHSKATPEQVRKFNRLQKKQQQDPQR
jgi:cytochrome c-type biogenesis protein CcmH/NrfG